MVKLIWLSLICTFSFQLIGQNLIPNPGFEDCDKCDSRGFKELGIGSGANDPIDWNAATYGSPDIYSITPNSGKRHGGFFLGFPKYEYLLNHFTEKLELGAVYQFSFWIRPSTQSINYIIDEIGVYIEEGPGIYPQAEPLKQLKPTFQSIDGDFISHSGYKQYSFEYQSCGGEDHFIVGRFRSLGLGDTTFVGTKRPANPASEPVYYFVDDFEMKKLTPPIIVDLIPSEIILCDSIAKQITIPPPFDQGVIKWSTGETTPTIEVSQEGELSVEVALNDKCSTILRDTAEIKIEKIKILSQYDSICIGDTIILSTDCNSCFNFKWSTNEISETINIIKADSFYMTASTNSCNSLHASKKILLSTEMIDSLLQFPNVVFPNGEEINQSFRALIKANKEKRIQSMKIGIFNRWGQKVYELKNKEDFWKPGSEFPMDTYMYVGEIEYQDCDRIRKSAIKGTVTLIR